LSWVNHTSIDNFNEKDGFVSLAIPKLTMRELLLGTFGVDFDLRRLELLSTVT